MSYSFRIGRIAGIPIFVHWTFVILLAWIGSSRFAESHDARTALASVGIVLAGFGCVVLHELGHALAARRFGVPTADITLLPIGGVARLQRIPEQPLEELVVAIAGPLVNITIAATLLALRVRLPDVGITAQPGGATGALASGWFSSLLEINLWLVLFNLIPAFPMDGGRVLRALLAYQIDYVRATRIAATVGQALAIAFAYLGLSHNPMLLLVALFVWIGAEAEARMVQERAMLRGVPIRAAMLTDYKILNPSSTLGQAAELLLAGAQQDFPVMGEKQPDRLLTRTALLAALASGGRDAAVSSAELTRLGQVDADEPLGPALVRLREEGDTCLEVLEEGRPVGLLTTENISELLLVRAALAESRGRQRQSRTGRSVDPLPV